MTLPEEAIPGPHDDTRIEEDVLGAGGKLQNGRIGKSFETAETETKKTFDHESLDNEIEKMIHASDLRALTGESCADDELLKTDQQALNEDIYSLLSTAPLFSGGYLYAFSIFLIQGGFLVLILLNMVDISANPVQLNGHANRLRLPADTEMQVTVAQFLGVIAIVIFAASQGDLFKGITHLVDGYDPNIVKSSPDATHFKWILGGFCQTLVGILMAIDLFILMMQSTTVIGLCLNFASIFVFQDFDDAAFAIGAMGLITRDVQLACAKVGHLIVSSENRLRTRYFCKGTILAMLIGLFIPYGIITSWKNSGKFMCGTLYVQFGDAYGPEWPYFSGLFQSLGNSRPDRAGGRIVYVDTTMFQEIQLAYCSSIPAWTFSNRTAVGDDYCDYIIRSTETTTFNAMEVASFTWYAGTSSIGDVPMDWLSVACADCDEDFCNPDVGQCVNNICECHDGFMGLACEFEVPHCKFLGLDLRSKTSLPSLPFASLFVENEYVKLEDDFGLADTFYEKPIYASFTPEGNLDTFVIFTGRRWVIMGTPQEKIANISFDAFFQNLKENDVTNQPLANLLNVTRTFTSLTPFFFSSPVDYQTERHQVNPTQVEWFFAKADDSLPLLGFRPDDSFPVSVKFICSHCNETTAPCLNGGTCNTTTTYCECLESYGGFLCEYSYNCRERGCLNGGTCDEVFNVCRDCDSFYYGNLCQFERVLVDEFGNVDFNQQAGLLGEDFFVCVNGTSCNNGGWCESNVTKCLCLPDFEGDYCEILRGNSTINVENGFICANTSCVNGGWCIGDEAECACPEPFTGTQCEEVMDNATLADGFFQCSNTTCLNEGYCTNETELCLCPPGFTGDFCESSTTLIEGHELCSNATCVNGGYCRNIVEVCYCPEGFEGTFCEIMSLSNWTNTTTTTTTAGRIL